MKFSGFAVIYLVISLSAYTQPLLLPQNRFATLEVEKKLNNYNLNNFTTCRPIVANQIGYDTLQQQIIESQKRTLRSNWFARKLKQEHLLQVKKENFYLAIDPVLDINATRDLWADTATYYTNTRGVFVEGSVGKKLAFYSSFYESQSAFPWYVNNFARATGVAPGMGRHKTFKANGFDYGMASGVISFDLSKHLNIQGGQGKNFVGDGYRSLLLSDNSFNYPFIKTQIHYKKFQYIFAYASLQELGGKRNLYGAYTEPLFTRKPYTFQFLQLQLKKRVQIGIFQSTIFQTRDSAGAYTFDYNILNPVLGANFIQYGLSNHNNVMAGLTARLRLSHDLTVYAQTAIDDLDPYNRPNSLKNKIAYQWGFRLNNAFIIKNMVVQFEQNRVRPYTYSASRVWQNYSHYNQALAHPLGANFKENIIFLNYRFAKDFVVQFKSVKIVQGIDTSANPNNGTDIFMSDLTANKGYYNNVYKRINGIQSNLLYLSFRLGYVVNYTTNLTVFAEAQMRSYDKQFAPVIKNLFINIGITSNLYNLYHDF